MRRGIGYVIQQGGLFPHRRVFDNVAVVPRLLGWDRARVERRVNELLELVGLDPTSYGRRFPHELSGGERQRVGVARALGADPPVLLMDEPFAAVDPVTRQRLQSQFLELQKGSRSRSSSSPTTSRRRPSSGDRIAVLSKGGVLEQYDTPAEILGRPATPFVADFVGADRGVRRLAVVQIEAADLATPPVVSPTATMDEVRRVAADSDGQDRRGGGRRRPAAGLGVARARGPTGRSAPTPRSSPPRCRWAPPCAPRSARCSSTTCAGSRWSTTTSAISGCSPRTDSTPPCAGRWAARPSSPERTSHAAPPGDRDARRPYQPPLRPAQLGVDGNHRRRHGGGPGGRALRVRMGGVLGTHRHPAVGDERAGAALLGSPTTLSFVAASTERISLLSHVVVLGYHHPLELVKRWGTLDVASHGRVILGVGVGSSQPEFELLGHRFDGRGERSDDALRAIRASWGVREPSYQRLALRVLGFRRGSLRPIPTAGHVGGRSHSPFFATGRRFGRRLDPVPLEDRRPGPSSATL